MPQRQASGLKVRTRLDQRGEGAGGYSRWAQLARGACARLDHGWQGPGSSIAEEQSWEGSLLYIRVRGVSARYQHFMLMPEGIKGRRKAEADKQSVV